MSRREIIDLYVNGVLSDKTRRNNHYKNLTSIYKTMYVEDTQEQLPGIDAGEQDDMIAVFYVDKNVLTEELVAQFRQLGGEGPVHVPASYFSNIERRFRGKGIESLAKEWMQTSSEANADPVTYNSLINKLFDSDIRGAEDLAELRQFVEWKKNQDDQTLDDILHRELSEDEAKTINFVDVLSPIVSYFIASDAEEFIAKMWNITEQSNRVGIGKGEMALSLLSRGYKGSPGDVKFDQNENGIQLDIEVKGLKGRPGKDNYAHDVGKRLQKLVDDNITLSDASIEEIQSQLYPSTLETRWAEISNYFNNTYRNKAWVKKNSGGRDGDVITTFLNNLRQIIDTKTDADVSTIISHISPHLEDLQKWAMAISPDQKHGIATDKFMKVMGTGTGGIAHYVHSKNMLRDISFISKLPSWQHKVTSFFVNISKDMNFDEDVLASGLVEVRGDTIKDQSMALQVAIKELLLTQGKEIVYDKETLSKLVAAIQVTAYCVADGFNRALFINDHMLTGRSIPTNPNNIQQTLDAIYNEFVQENYKIDMGLDSANKGVQISYNG